MGIDVEKAAEALRKCNNDIHWAMQVVFAEEKGDEE
jgi:hypothetical protein